VGSSRHALTIGAGISGGHYGGDAALCFTDADCWGVKPYVVWGNFELGGEHWWPGGFALRYFIGYAHGCTTSSCSAVVNNESLNTPYFGAGMGYAF
jgi:hypothetical protein